jgi:isopenicillin N synthase-like dioxygenase
MNRNIAVLDLNDYLIGGEKKDNFLRMLKHEFSTKGFVILKNHGIKKELLEDMYKYMKKFFTETTLSQRLAYEYKNLGHRIGYTPMRVEKAVGAKKPDEKHFWHYRDEDMMPYVNNVPGFSETSDKLFVSYRACAITMLRAISETLGLPLNYFDEKEGNSTMRMLHYPATNTPRESTTIGDVVVGGNSIGMCADGHSDINLITLLPQKYPGLRLIIDGVWTPVPTVNDSIIVNCGDMLQYFTNGMFISGWHEVVCPKGMDRYSIPYFSHVHEHVNIKPLPQFGSYDPAKFPFETAGEFLDYRLKEIGLT